MADYDPTAALRFLLNFDFRAEDNVVPGNHSESVAGANLVIRYNFSDAFNAAIRGEYYFDKHGDTLGVGGPVDASGAPTKTEIYDGTLTLTYGIGTHLAFMLDNRIDASNNPIFSDKTAGNFGKTQFTSVLGVIASTK